MNNDVITVNLLEKGNWLHNSVNGYAAHVGRVIHQHEALKYQKENLQFNEAVIHMVLSGNHNCKFAEETQAFHFGATFMIKTLKLIFLIQHRASEPDLIVWTMVFMPYGLILNPY
ncbi:hypothetical protein PR048_004639 [Dryococelus australis]|uniref:Uncharacterized protein n=1 Tax=Dryococelus australis TaxID=614101 RepID=A0ABQ9I5Z6_9NEOP|nr:hypothetical protein PR048_004639 [Dryococelus australis]